MPASDWFEERGDTALLRTSARLDMEETPPPWSPCESGIEDRENYIIHEWWGGALDVEFEPEFFCNECQKSFLSQTDLTHHLDNAFIHRSDRMNSPTESPLPSLLHFIKKLTQRISNEFNCESRPPTTQETQPCLRKHEPIETMDTDRVTNDIIELLRENRIDGQSLPQLNDDTLKVQLNMDVISRKKLIKSIHHMRRGLRESPPLLDVETWTPEQVTEWVRERNYGDNHAQLFLVNRINGEILVQLQLGDLEEIGVEALGDRIRIRQGVTQLSTDYNVVDSQVPVEMICPISQEIMVDPVVAADGFSYERKPLEEWIELGGTSPLTGLPLTDKRVLPNLALRAMICDYLEKNRSIEGGCSVTHELCKTSTTQPSPTHVTDLLDIMAAGTGSLLQDLSIAWRLWTLTASFGSVLIGSLLGYNSSGSFSLYHFVLSVIGACGVHTIANLANSYYDWKRGVDKKETSGDRAMFDTRFTPQEIKFHLKTFLYGSAVVGALLVFSMPTWEKSIGMAIRFAAGCGVAYFYTASPYSLKYMALGDVATLVAFGPLVVEGAYYIQLSAGATMGIATLPSVLSAYLFSIPNAFLTDAIVHSNNARDADGDKKAGVHTVANIIGPKASFFAHCFLFFSSYLCLPFFAYFFASGYGRFFLFAPLLTLPTAMKAVDDFKSGRMKEIPERIAAFSLQFSVLFALGIYLSGSKV
ncbi:hypothetical protein PROFUN_11614 [Planoprotostelium fungivorum]|uniref:Uncharacterized protein n=1 Tax=Planoprotostelium fungivorum TaxID=1890364 RepID=A0A2P6N2E6_9EUKA|nr:hypothetical protein PROFUN_11614 [Planoprotostelium fungivorum]